MSVKINHFIDVKKVFKTIINVVLNLEASCRYVDSD